MLRFLIFGNSFHKGPSVFTPFLTIDIFIIHIYLYFLRAWRCFSHCFRNWDCFAQENNLEECRAWKTIDIPVYCRCLWLHRCQGGESASFGYMSRKELITRAKGTQALSNPVHPTKSVIDIYFRRPYKMCSQ